MREIDVLKIENTVCELFIEANKTLPSDVTSCLSRACNAETSRVGRAVLSRVMENLDAARELNIPICQDTGMAVVFADIGQDVHIVGGSFSDALNRGVARAYNDGLLRKSVVADPLYGRKNTDDNTPAVIHIRLVEGDNIKITAAPKGFGSENMSALKMFTPSASEDDIVSFVVNSVKNAGGNPCPPVVVGVGIGGDFELCAELSKRALLREIDDRNTDENYAKLEERLLFEINKLGIGPQGFGGSVTALAVKIEKHPTHIAGLPVAVNINCHVARHVSREL
jgi:fumarate hydratase subunit alpha